MPGCSGHMDAQGLCSTRLSNFFSHRSACAACSVPTARTFSLSPSNLPQHILCAGLMTLRELCAISATKGGQCVRLLEPRMDWYSDPDSLFEMRCVREHRFAASICVLRADGWCPVCEDLVRVTNDLARAEISDDEAGLRFLINEGERLGVESDALRRGRERLKVLEAAQARREALGVGSVPYPNEFVCPITYERMQCPCVASDGHTYERTAIETVIRGSCVSPLTREPLLPHVFPNTALRNRIRAYHDELLHVAEAVTAVASERARAAALAELRAMKLQTAACSAHHVGGGGCDDDGGGTCTPMGPAGHTPPESAVGAVAASHLSRATRKRSAASAGSSAAGPSSSTDASSSSSSSAAPPAHMAVTVSMRGGKRVRR